MFEGNKRYTQLLNDRIAFKEVIKSNKCTASNVCCTVLLVMVTVAGVCQLLAASHLYQRVIYSYAQRAKAILPLYISGEVQERVISCYYNFPSRSYNRSKELGPSDIHANLCTHINVAFARIVNKEIHLEDHEVECLRDIVKLKLTNSNIKILLSVGGAATDSGFSDMVLNHTSRKIFIKSIKTILRNYNLDGVDLDWEFPGVHTSYAGARERQHFSQLIREIRMEYVREKRDYLLTIAAAAPETIVNVAYDVDQLNEYLDYVNLMTYDYHFFNKYTPFIGFNSPLYVRSSEQFYMATLNINYTIQMYINKGLDPSKIVVGIPTYGHTFTLVNVNNHQVGSPASGFGSIGDGGFINYPDVCKFSNTHKNNVTIKQDDEAKVPYLYLNKDWISYDDPHSVTEKAKYIKENKLRGAMIYSLNADDFLGVCIESGGEATKFPLSQSVNKALGTAPAAVTSILR